MNEHDSVRELLGRAVETVAAPTGQGSESVFARAARVRRRRRAVTTGAVAAVAAGVVLGTGMLPAGRDAGVAASPTAGELGGGAAGFTKLLPTGVGKVREVSLMRLVKGVPKAPQPKDVGPYDGDYTVTRDGGTGFVSVRVQRSRHVQDLEKDPCTVRHEIPQKASCTTEQVDGGTLSVWQVTWDSAGAGGGQPRYGTELEARLLREDGTVLNLRDSTGWLGQGSQGPLLKTFPLARAELRELALKPQLLP